MQNVHLFILDEAHLIGGESGVGRNGLKNVDVVRLSCRSYM